jgi:serine/threonine protein kinase
VEPIAQPGKYTLGGRLGSGATADVFTAMQLSVERTVAIKVMHSHLVPSHDFAARFQREARAMGQLQHPHITPVIDFDATGAHPYMVIEYLPGGSLRDYLDETVGPLDSVGSVAIVRQLADALHYAHSEGMVHRDVKPANVMFVGERRHHAVLTDFGIARLADDSMTATGTVLRTPAYISPEQVRGARAEAAADQYSLGIMLFEMVTGSFPFQAESPHALMMKHMSEAVPSACAKNDSVSTALDDVIGRSMAKFPAERFATTGEMMRALDQAMAADVQTVTGALQTVVQHRLLTERPDLAIPTSDAGALRWRAAW